MNEKGFATIFGLCLILIIALIVKGIQESEMNHSYETDDFQIEMDLQNAADSGIYKAVEFVHNNPDILPLNEEVTATTAARKGIQYPIPLDSTDPMNTVMTIKSSSGDIQVRAWGERIIMNHYNVTYKSKSNYDEAKFVAVKMPADEVVTRKNTHAREMGYTIFSLASIKSKRTGEDIYRRSFAYVTDKIVIEWAGYISKVRDDVIKEDERKVIHFMNIAADNLKYK